jgi:hypothetical protein
MQLLYLKVNLMFYQSPEEQHALQNNDLRAMTDLNNEKLFFEA